MADNDTQATEFKGGVKVPGVTVGPASPVRARMAKIATGAGGYGTGRQRGAGMLVDTVQTATPYTSGYWLGSYRSSYAYGLTDRSGTYDIPTYFVQMNDQNGGLLYWPVTLREKYSWFRYWARSDAYIGRSLEMLADLPMSKLSLNMPKVGGKLTKELREEILRFFVYQLELLDAFSLLQSILWEWNMIGNVFIFHEWDEDKKMWVRAVMLPPEEVFVFQYPFSEKRRVEYKPQRLISIIKSGGRDMSINGPDTSSQVPGIDQECSRADMDEKILSNIPNELVEMVQREGCIVMDSDPMTGSFVHQLARRKAPYEDLGASILERVLVPMLQKEHYRYTQLSLASRNMTPKNLITAPGLMPEDVDVLRTQVDLSFLDPEYSVITNYEVNWQQIGAENRLIDLQREYDVIENQIFAGLGVTRELLTGEGSFGGSKITVEILNTMFLLTREVLKSYVEKKLFMPICEARHWYEEDKNGIKTYWYPKLNFNRLTIRDNAEVFDSLMQLYQKGSLPIDILYELFNLNADDMTEKLQQQLFTVSDTNFNRVIEEASVETGRAMMANTDIGKKVAKYLNLKWTKPDEGQPPTEGDGFAGFGGFAEGDSAAPAGEAGPKETTDKSVPEESTDEKPVLEKPDDKQAPAEPKSEVDSVAEAVAEELPAGASEEDIRKVIDKVDGANEKTSEPT